VHLAATQGDDVALSAVLTPGGRLFVDGREVALR
jgi:hypothetical protein